MHTVQLLYVQETVTMLVLVLHQKFVLVLEARWGLSVRLIVGVVGMVVVMVMVLVIVILDLYIILHPKNANTHAMAILAQAVMVLIFSHAQQAVYTVHAITAHVHAGQVLPVKIAQQKLQSPILTVTSA